MLKKQAEKDSSSAIGGDQIIAFSYSFSSSLLQKLKKLSSEENIFTGTYSIVQINSFTESGITNLASVLFEHLASQIHLPNPVKIHPGEKFFAEPHKVTCFIRDAEEFLNAFKKNIKSK